MPFTLDDFSRVRVAWLLREYATSGACGPLRAAECEDLANQILPIQPEVAMPFKSEAQRQRAKDQLARGEIDQKTYDEWDKGTPKKIPDRIHPKKKK